MTLTSISLNFPLNTASIEQARRLRAITKSQLAQELGISSRSYSRHLNEGFPDGIQESLSSALTVPPKFLDAPHPDNLELSNINFRAGRRAQAVHREAAIANGNLLTQLDSYLHETYTIPALDWVDLSYETPKLAAQLLRQAWGLGIGPAPNMVQLCESRGISVYGLTTIAKSVDAFSAWVGTRPFIFTSRQKTPERSRFDIAHELGHLVLHHNSAGGDNPQQEQEADAFASEFLIPQAALKTYLPKLPNLSQIFDFKAVYKVSALATVVSLHRADILSNATYKRRCAALNQRGFKDGEPNGMPHFERSRIFDHAFDKDSPKFQSRKDVAKELGLPQDVVDSGTFATKFTVVS
ncbi:ImmA/IrrE family metallo-endopeptidase [Corynebacterium casei]|uniref:ImmA/IrrE family metallo-endopeptidase n=1 Tax=Corynebacterium casei TaxID=160386 RepID=UPI003FD0A71E